MSDAAASPAPGKKVFVANIVLLALTMLALTIWFDRHLAGWVRQTLLLGSTITLVAGWGIIQGWIKWGIGKELTEGFRNFLGTRRATRLWGAVALPLILLIYLGTASLHLSLADGTEDRLTFDLYDGDELLSENVTLGGKKRELTRPFFFHFRPSDLRVRVKEPPRYDEARVKLGLASAVPLTLPPKTRDFHLLRFMPARGLFSVLPRPEETTRARYELRLRRLSPDPAIWPPIELRFQTVYAGASVDDLKWMARAAQDGDDYKPHAERYLDRFDTPAAARERFHRLWSVPAYYPTTELRPGDTIACEVRVEGRNDPLLNSSLTLSDAQVQNIFLEVQ